MLLRPTTTPDLHVLLGWVGTHQDMVMWSGPTFTWPLRVDQLAKSLTADRRSWWTGTDPETGQIMGFASLLVNQDAQSMRLGFVIANPAVRGRGHGRELVEAAVDRAFDATDVPTMTLGVYTHNIRAIRLYESLGFELTGVSLEMAVGDESWTSVEMKLDREAWQLHDR